MLLLHHRPARFVQILQNLLRRPVALRAAISGRLRRRRRVWCRGVRYSASGCWRSAPTSARARITSRLYGRLRSDRFRSGRLLLLHLLHLRLLRLHGLLLLHDLLIGLHRRRLQRGSRRHRTACRRYGCRIHMIGFRRQDNVSDRLRIRFGSYHHVVVVRPVE